MNFSLVCEVETIKIDKKYRTQLIGRSDEFQRENKAINTYVQSEMEKGREGERHTVFYRPHDTTEPVLVHRAWDETCEELGERRLLTPVIYKLIANRGAQCHGELKTKVRPLAEIMYGFKSGHNKKDINYNRTHAENLKDGARFAFKLCSHTLVGRARFRFNEVQGGSTIVALQTGPSVQFTIPKPNTGILLQNQTQ
ncbi:hypothetical protein B0H14DRAFT_2609242 [Mycena olivaceomarginata]|nr:hypothetical protein B0H14DRAFT_2609242 [Mycena olivaceomarginata]